MCYCVLNIYREVSVWSKTQTSFQLFNILHAIKNKVRKKLTYTQHREETKLSRAVLSNSVAISYMCLLSTWDIYSLNWHVQNTHTRFWRLSTNQSKISQYFKKPFTSLFPLKLMVSILFKTRMILSLPSYLLPRLQ